MYVYYKCHILIELKLLKESMLIKQVHQKSDICHYLFFLNYSFKFQPNACNRCHDLFMMSMNLSDISILNTNVFYYFCIINLISNTESRKLMLNADLTKKSRTL